jgi:hypothetical protein
MKAYEDVAKEAASKVYRTVRNELARVAGVQPSRNSSPRRKFETIKDVLDKRTQYSQEVIKIWAEHMTKAGLHPRFPRFEEISPTSS